MGSVMELRPYQERAIDFILKEKKCYLAIDMGLGKTAIALHTLNMLGLRALIVAPINVALNTWPEEIKDWYLENDISYQVLHGKDKDYRRKQSAMAHFINYEGLNWLYTQMYDDFVAGKPFPYQVMILDESTFVKDNESKRFGLLCAIRDAMKYIILLSGTPSPNSLLDLWTQYYLIDRGETLGDNYIDFRSTYFEQDPYRTYRWNLRFGAADAIHRKIAPKTFRLESSDYISLPSRTKVYHKVEFNKKERALYESFRKDFVLCLEEADVAAFNEASLSSKLRQFVQGFVYGSDDVGDRTVHLLHNRKIVALRYLLEANPGSNFIVLIQFKQDEQSLNLEFPEAKFVTGNTPAAEKIEHLAAWNRGEVPLLFAHPRSIGSGLNLQSGGHHMVWYTQTFSLYDYDQTNKRLHRSGQKNPVTIHHIVIRNTIDERVVEVLNERGMTQEKLLEYMKAYTKEYLYD